MAQQTRWGDRVARRRDILDAGRQLLTERGSASVQMREVAHRAGIALGTVYTYFPDKEALYAALFADRLDWMLAELEPAVEKKMALDDLFVLVATLYRGVHAEFGKEYDVLTALRRQRERDPSVGDQLVVSAGRILAVLRTVIAEAGVEDPELALVTLWSTITGLADHFTGARYILHLRSWDETVRYAAHTFTRALFTTDTATIDR